MSAAAADAIGIGAQPSGTRIPVQTLVASLSASRRALGWSGVAMVAAVFASTPAGHISMPPRETSTF